MKYDLIISGGYVVLADRVETTDIGIKDGRIVTIAPNLEGADKVVCAKGQ